MAVFGRLVFVMGVLVFGVQGYCSAQSTATTQAASTPTSQTNPTSALTTQASVAEIRALIERAIAMKDDPKKAQAMMVLACDLTSKLPPGAGIKGLMVEFDPEQDGIRHLIQPASTKVLTETKKLSTHIELIEKYLSSTYSFVGGRTANGKGVIIPMARTDKVLKEQTLQRDGNAIFVVTVDSSKETRWKKYHVSPDENYVVLEDKLGTKPMEILVVKTGKTVAVETHMTEEYCNDDLFSMLKWDDNSEAFIGVSGTIAKEPGQTVTYRELWRVQADSGKAHPIKRQSDVTEIRALVERAITMKDDPKKAQAMMVLACDLTSKLPHGADVKGLMVEFNPDQGGVQHLCQPTSTTAMTEMKKLSAHIELAEKYLSSTYPFIGMADNDKGMIFPKAQADKVLKEQTLQREGKTIFVVPDALRKETRWKGIMFLRMSGTLCWKIGFTQSP